MNHWRVPPEQLDYIWPSVSGLIEAALVRAGLFNIEDAHSYIADGTWQLWVAYEGQDVTCAALTEIFEFPKEKVLRVTMATGLGRDGWVGRVEMMEGWARSLGCGRVQVLGRPGWEKVLKDYRKTHVMLEKKL